MGLLDDPADGGAGLRSACWGNSFTRRNFMKKVKHMKKRKYVKLDSDALNQIKAEEFGRGYQSAQDVIAACRKQVADQVADKVADVEQMKNTRRLREDEMRSQSVDAIAHAIVALANLVSDGAGGRIVR